MQEFLIAYPKIDFLRQNYENGRMARFSVIIAAYNSADYIGQTIDSILSQTFTDYELIVVDDGSTDQTQDILQSYGARIKTIYQRNQGPEVAYKTGVSLANGEYLAFLDSDDLFLLNTLETYDKIIRTLDSPPLIIGCMKRFWDGQDVPTNNESTDVIEVLKYCDYLSKDVGMPTSQSIIVILRSAFEEISGAIDSTSNSYLFDNDSKLLLQAGTHGPCIIIRHPNTVAYRQHAAQSSKKVAIMVQGVLSLIHMVRSGQYYGGHTRRFARYAFLGGQTYAWCRAAFKSHQRGLAARLLISGWPTIAAAALRKLWVSIHKTGTLIRIKNKD